MVFGGFAMTSREQHAPMINKIGVKLQCFLFTLQGNTNILFRGF